MNQIEYKSNFDHLYHYFLEIYGTYYSWKGLQNKEYERIYDRAKYFWSAVLISLQNEWLLNIAKCFEKSTYSKKGVVVSVFALIEHHPDPIRAKESEELLIKYEDLINSILRLRDHQLAHFNAMHLNNPKILIDKFPIKYGEVEDLLVEFPKILSLLNPEPGNGYMLGNFIDEPNFEAKFIMDSIKLPEK